MRERINCCRGHLTNTLLQTGSEKVAAGGLCFSHWGEECPPEREAPRAQALAGWSGNSPSQNFQDLIIRSEAKDPGNSVPAQCNVMGQKQGWARSRVGSEAVSFVEELRWPSSSTPPLPQPNGNEALKVFVKISPPGTTCPCNLARGWIDLSAAGRLLHWQTQGGAGRL